MDPLALTNYSLNTCIDIVGVFPVWGEALQGEEHPSPAKSALVMTRAVGFPASSGDYIDKYLILECVTFPSPGSAGCIYCN